MRKTIEIDLKYQQFVDSIPTRYGDVYKTACSGDAITIKSWKDTWIKNYKMAKDRFGEFGSRSYGQLYGINRHKPAIVIGSGPSLKNSIEALRENKNSKTPVLSVSCLHNFGYLEDEGCHADYYLTLDSGPITLTDVTEGRKEIPEYYWEKTKDHALIANVASDPGLFDKWRGKIYLFNTLIPDMDIREAFTKVEKFSHYISTGGNALGGCMYSAKAIMSSSEIIYVGADFCFNYNSQFHSYPTQYDNYQGGGQGTTLRWPDIYGIPRDTWPSYLNFKLWFDWVTYNVPGRWCSASEGILGAYPEGNIRSYHYGDLSGVLETYRIADTINLSEMKVVNGVACPVVGPDGKPIKKPVDLGELFKDSLQPLDITLF